MNKLVSSIGYSGHELHEILNRVESLPYILEFSSAGFDHSEENWDLFKSYPGMKIMHNYFPGYKNSFVLNLASLDAIVYNASIKHCKKCIMNTSKYSSSKFYGVHAGFCFHMLPEHLGKRIPLVDSAYFELYKNRFISAVSELTTYAESLGVSIYLENNVLTKENHNGDLLPFLMIESDGIIDIMSEFKDKSNFGLLLDTAHLKVSCKTLDLDPVKEFKKIERYVKAIHHSDNNGLTDSNNHFNEDYWFLEVMSEGLRILPNTLEMRNMNSDMVSRSFNLLGI